MNPSRDHHLVLLVIQMAPDLFSFRDNQTQWGHTHCCPFLEPDSDVSFASCLEALVVRGTWYWPNTHTYHPVAKSGLTRGHIFHMFLTECGSPGVHDSSCSENKIPLLWLSFLSSFVLIAFSLFSLVCYLSLVIKSHVDFRAPSIREWAPFNIFFWEKKSSGK